MIIFRSWFTGGHKDAEGNSAVHYYESHFHLNIRTTVADVVVKHGDNIRHLTQKSQKREIIGKIIQFLREEGYSCKNFEGSGLDHEHALLQAQVNYLAEVLSYVCPEVTKVTKDGWIRKSRIVAESRAKESEQ